MLLVKIIVGYRLIRSDETLVIYSRIGAVTASSAWRSADIYRVRARGVGSDMRLAIVAFQR